MTEDQIESEVKNRAEADGWLVRKVSWPGRRAAMDRLFLKDGRHVWIEFKKPKVEVDPDSQQGREHTRFREHGAEVHVVNNVAYGLALLGLV